MQLCQFGLMLGWTRYNFKQEYARYFTPAKVISNTSIRIRWKLICGAARYYVNGTANPQNGSPGDVSPWAASEWDLWQYTSIGSISGINGNVDLDVFNGTYSELLAWTNTTTSTSPELAHFSFRACHHRFTMGRYGAGSGRR